MWTVFLASNLYAYDIYSYKEYCMLMSFIKENRPNQQDPWGWPMEEVKPRKEWLDKQIKLTKPKRKYSKWAIFRIKIKQILWATIFLHQLVEREYDLKFLKRIEIPRKPIIENF